MKNDKLISQCASVSGNCTIDEFLTPASQIVLNDTPIDDIAVVGGVLGGLWVSDGPVAKPQHVKRERSFQLQVKSEDNYFKCVQVTLQQVDRSVAARVDWAGWIELDDKHNYGCSYPRNHYKHADVVTDDGTPGYGVMQLEIQITVGDKRHNVKFCKFLTAENQVVIENIRIMDVCVTGAILGGGWAVNHPQARIECVSDLVRLQMQARCSDYLKCVHITLQQVSTDVVARVDSAACVKAGPCGVPDYGYDFSTQDHENVSVATDCGAIGYGVARLSLMNVPDWLSKIRSVLEPAEGGGCRVRVIMSALGDIDLSDIGVGLHWLNDDNSYGGWFLDKAPSFVKGSDSELEAVFTPADFKIPPGVKKLFPVVFFAPNQVYDKAWFKTEKEDAIECKLVLNIDSLNRKGLARTDALISNGNDIFISYSRKDFAIVRSITEEIERRVGIKPWIDLEGIETGSQFNAVIIKAINRCKVFIFMVSPNCLKSPNTEKEYEFAKRKKKKICPVIIAEGETEGELNDWFQFEFGNIDCIDYRNKLQREKFFSNLQGWAKANDRQRDVDRQRWIIEGKIEKAKIELQHSKEELEAQQRRNLSQIRQSEEKVKSLTKQVGGLQDQLADLTRRRDDAMKTHEKLLAEIASAGNRMTDRITRLQENITSLEVELKAI